MSLVFHYSKDLPRCTELKEKYLCEQVQVLKNIFQPEQKSQAWYEMRNTMLTASDWGTVLGENHYSNGNEVLKKKCGDDTFITNAAMQWGNKYENVAVLIYEHRNTVQILEFGCIRHPFIPFLGASPDGITMEGVMLEIKCPTSRKITGTPPSYYWCQVQGQLEVCELDRCDFLECSFKEYDNDKDPEYEYYADNYEGNKLLNQYGHEKGVIAEFYKSSSKTFMYIYSPVCIMGDELDIWKKETVEKHQSDKNMFSCFSYWYLQEVSCVPIYRNQEWFNTSKVELEIFWNKVLKYRELGLDVLLQDIQRGKDEKKQIKLDVKIEKEKAKPVKKVSAPAKRQKKIKEFILFDNNREEDNVKELTHKTNKTDKTDKSSVSSDDSYDSDNFKFDNKISMFSDVSEDTCDISYTVKKVPVRKPIVSNPLSQLSMFSD